jgi:SAM-dependent methyltransferase
MLYRLRDGLSRMNGRFTVHEGDFADFTLPEPVPFVVCAGDSVNYVADLDELATVFRCVASCLRPGGFFLFDAIDGPPPKLPPGHGTVTELRGHIDGPFHICLCYDTEARLNDGYCLSPRGVEEHRRILISKEDITSAAAATGLMVEDLFRQDRIFCVLRRPPAP